MTDFGERSKPWKLKQQSVLTTAQAYYKTVSEQWEKKQKCRIVS